MSFYRDFSEGESLHRILRFGAFLALIVAVCFGNVWAEDIRGAAPYRLVAQEGEVNRSALVPDFVIQPTGITALTGRFDSIESDSAGMLRWSIFCERKSGRCFLVYDAGTESIPTEAFVGLQASAARYSAVVVGCRARATDAWSDAQLNSPEWDLRPTELRLWYDPTGIVPYEFRIDAPRKAPMATKGAAHIFDFSLRISGARVTDAWDTYIPARVAAGEFNHKDVSEIAYVPRAYETPIRTLSEAGMTLLWLRKSYPQTPIVLKPLRGPSAHFESVVNKELRKFSAIDGVDLASFPRDGEMQGLARTESFSSTRGPWWWFYRLAQKNRQISRLDGKVDLVMVGDSITHFWEGCAYWSSGRVVYQELQREFSVLNLGYGGDETKNVLWRLLNGELDGYRAKCIALMIGTNDRGSAESVADGVRQIIAVIREKQPTATVLLQSILPRGAPQDSVRLRNEKANVLIRGLADGDHVVWCDLTRFFLNRDGTIISGLMTDEPDPKTGVQLKLHPHRAGYEVWRQALLPLLYRAVTNVRHNAAIIDRIDGAQKCESLNPHFAKAFEFLRRKDLAELPVGRYEIDGENCWAMIQEAKLTPMGDETTVEAHRQYIDIQAPITGDETIGLCAFDTNRTDLVFDEKKDIVFFKAKVEPRTLHPGEFAIFFPRKDAHAPGHCVGENRTIRKLVIKVRAE